MRTLWIQCHPAPFSTVYAALHTSISDALEQLQAGSPTSAPVEGVEMADLRGRVNVFDIVGPRSSQVLHGALHPVSPNGDVQEVRPSFCLLTPGYPVMGANSPGNLGLALTQESIYSGEYCSWYYHWLVCT